MIHEDYSPRSRLVAAVLCGLFGVVGAHRFYVGKHGTGVCMLLTFGGLGIWAMIDLIFVLLGVFRDAEGRKIVEWFEQQSPRSNELVDRIEALERRMTDMQDIVIALDDRLKRAMATRE